MEANRRTILVIEADAAARQAHAEMLRFVGFVVVEAASPEEGLDLARSQRPRLIFLDLALPEMQSWGTLHQLRADPATATIPVAALVALPLDEAEIEAAGLCAQVQTGAGLFRLVEEAEHCLGSVDESLPHLQRLQESDGP